MFQQSIVATRLTFHRSIATETNFVEVKSGDLFPKIVCNTRVIYIEV